MPGPIGHAAPGPGGMSGSTWSRRIGAVFASARVQMLGALACGIAGAHFLRVTYEQYTDDALNYDSTLIGTTLAMCLGYVIYRKVTSLPGTAALVNIVPAFLTSYLVVTALYYALRLEFSRQQFLLSFFLVVLFFYLAGFIAVRLRKPVYGVIPGGRSEALTRLAYVDWIPIARPADARMHRRLPLVADLHADTLTPDWARFLADEAISGRRIFNTRHLLESLEGKVEIEHLSENSFGHLAPDSLYGPAKYYVDMLLALLALVALAPLLMLVAAAIRLESPGPAIFRQGRMGYQGRPFTIYKFRSMRAEAPAGNLEADMTLSDDQRITRVGKVIRKFRIDELPQIANILLGQMSWIGPRPETVRLSELYEGQLPFYRYRHIVRPGITGWAQVKQGHVTHVSDVHEKLQYDFFYIRHFSVWLDFLIIIQTVRVIFTGSGAK